MPRHPDRLLRLVGATNFRDLGGYIGHDGRTLRWRRLFRSDHLGALTDADKAMLRELGVSRSFDFRGRDESAAATYELPGVTKHPLTIEPTVVQRMQDLVVGGQALTVPLVTDLMKDLYRGLVNDQTHRYAEFFEQLLQAEAPVVFHCTAGKDRTGLAAALILLALGVPRSVVEQDYLLTNEVYRHPVTTRSGIPADALAVLWRVQADFLDTALQAIDDDHGGIDRYLNDRLRLTPAALRELASRYLADSDEAPSVPRPPG